MFVLYSVVLCCAVVYRALLYNSGLFCIVVHWSTLILLQIWGILEVENLELGCNFFEVFGFDVFLCVFILAICGSSS